MTSPSPRPTREQVDAAPDGPMPPNFEGHEGRECGEHRTVGLHRAWCHDCTTWCYPNGPCPGCELPQLRAEVDRLRAELAEIHEAIRPRTDPSLPQRRDDPEEIRARIAALTPRTPQPAASALHRLALVEKLATEWVESGRPQRLELRGPGRRALAQLAAAHDDYLAPQPAVPDGEDVPDDPLVEAPGFGVTNREYWPASWVKAAEEEAQLDDRPTDAEFDAFRAAIASGRGPTSLDGEDVPARLEAAADALGRLDWSSTAEELRHLVMLLRQDDAVEVRAAVAAALARPTGHQQ